MRWPVVVARGSNADNKLIVKGGCSDDAFLLLEQLKILGKYLSCDPSQCELFPRLHACNSTRLLKYLKYECYLGGAIST